MIVLFLILLNTLPLWATNYTFTDAVIDISQFTKDTLLYGGTTDKCKKIVVRESQVYHLATNGVYETWWKWGFSSYFSVKGISTYESFDFGVSASGMTAVFTYAQVNGSKIAVTKFNANYSEASTVVLPSFLSLPADYIFATDETYFYCFSREGYQLTGYNVIYVVDKETGIQIRNLHLPYTYSKIAVTPDLQKAVLWTGQTIILIFSLPDLINIGHYSPQVLPTSEVTSKITFSDDSSLAVIETDQFNPLVLFSLTTYQLVNQVAIGQSIKEAHFLDSTSQILVVLGVQSTIFVDFSNSNSQYSTPLMRGVVFAGDQMNNIFVCYNNTISQQYIHFTRIVSANSQPTPSKVDEQFFISYNLSNSEINALQGLNNTLSIASEATTLMYTFAVSTPMTIYFLGFINYLSLSSLYVLLNFPIPEHVYNCLAFTYQQININFLSLLGVNIDVPMVSTEKVDSRRALFFEISSDVLSANADGCIFLALNIFAIVMFQKICNAVLRKGNIIRRLINQEKTEMIYGQIINMLTPLTLPWIFLFLKGGIMDIETKINTVCYSLLFFACFGFPILYLYRLLSDRRNELLKCSKLVQQPSSKIKQNNLPRVVSSNKSQLASKDNNPLNQRVQKEFRQNSSGVLTKNIFLEASKQIQQSQKRDVIIKSQIEKEMSRSTSLCHRKYNLAQLFTVQIVQQWHLCQANCLLPALVICTEPAYFLMPILIFSAIGLIINFNKKEHRLNSFVMSLYPFLFHISFMIFYWCSVVEILVITEICCLLVYFLGSLHYFLFMLYQILHFLYMTLRQTCKSSKVSPLSLKFHEKRQIQMSSVCEKKEVSKKDVSVMKIPRGRIKKVLECKNALKVDYTVQVK